MRKEVAMIDSVKLCKLGSMVYPIMLAQAEGELTESKAAELIGLDIVTYREAKWNAIKSILTMIEQLPSPLILLLDAHKNQKS